MKPTDCYTSLQIAKRVGVTRGRVLQLIDELGLHPTWANCPHGGYWSFSDADLRVIVAHLETTRTGVGRARISQRP